MVRIAAALLGLALSIPVESNDHYSELAFETDDRIVWTGRRVTEGVAPEDAPVSFVETWTRR